MMLLSRATIALLLPVSLVGLWFLQRANNSPEDDEVPQAWAWVAPADRPDSQFIASAPAATVAIARAIREFEGPDGVFTPDPTIAAGPDSVLAIVNGPMELRSKDGALLARDTITRFFSTSAYDPKTVFDQLSGRFFISATMQGDPQLLLVAVSRSSRPASFDAGQWFIYRFDAQRRGASRSADKADYPQLGVGNDTITIATLMAPSVTGNVITEEVIRVFDKATLTRGNSLGAWNDFFGLNHPPLTDGRIFPVRQFQPAIHLDSTRQTSFMLTTGLGNCDVTVWGIEAPAGAPPQLSSKSLQNPDCDRPTNAADVLPNAPQADGDPIYVGPDGFEYAVYRDGSLWGSRIVRRRYATGVVSGIQWYEVDVSTWPDSVQMRQHGTITEEGVWYAYSSLGVDGRGNALIVMNRFSAGTYPAIAVASRRRDDARGTFGPVGIVKNSLAPIRNVDFRNNNRFGDYSGISVDPADGSFWVLAEYMRAAGAPATWVANIRVE